MDHVPEIKELKEGQADAGTALPLSSEPSGLAGDVTEKNKNISAFKAQLPVNEGPVKLKPNAAYTPLGADTSAVDPKHGGHYAPAKDIMQTRGGKAVNLFINKGIGFIGNSTLSLSLTYGLNPRPGFKTFRRTVVDGISNILSLPPKQHEHITLTPLQLETLKTTSYLTPLAPPEVGTTTHAKDFKYMIGNGIRSAVEILMMMIAGFTTTAIMTPFVSRREKMAYWLNKKMGWDTDIVPFDMRKVPTPQNKQEWLQFALQNKVNTRQTAGDLWKGRLLGSVIIVLADVGLSDIAVRAENKGVTALSQDAVAWSVGGFVYDKILSKAGFTNRGMERVVNFYERHEAGIKDIAENQTEIYRRMQDSQERAWNAHQKQLGTVAPFPGVHQYRGAISEGTRLLAKEIGWTFIMSEFVENFTNMYQHRRIRSQFKKAVQDLHVKGLLTDEFTVTMDKEGRVSVTPREQKNAHNGSKSTQVDPPSLVQQPEEADKNKLQGKGGKLGGAGASTTWSMNENVPAPSVEAPAELLEKNKNNPSAIEQKLNEKTAKHADGFAKTGSYTQTAEARKEVDMAGDASLAMR